jgi:hypothetical protein
MTSQRQAIRTLSGQLKVLGYLGVPGPVSGATSVLYRPVHGLVLTIGIQVSTRYANRFTASFYLSRSFEWGYLPDGFPEQAYRRIGRFLSAEERTCLLDPFFSQVGVVDAWWIGFDKPVLSAFTEAVTLAEPRFVEQPGLVDAVSGCQALMRHECLLEEVASLARDMKQAPADLECQPSTYLKSAGAEWYWAAEVALRQQKREALKPQFVGMVALDAWRVETLIRGRRER